MITLQDIRAAHDKIRDVIELTPCTQVEFLSEQLKSKVFIKLDNLQKTGSFKERGALNRLLRISGKDKNKGVVCASAGNHAQAIAYHATRLGILATIFMPRHTPVFKVTRTENYGGKIRLVGDNYDETYEAAKEFAKKSGAIYVHAYDDEDVIAGQGTIALEVMSQLPKLDVLVVPVGGGGLLAGSLVAAKNLNPKIRVVGVEIDKLDSMRQALKKKKVVTLPPARSIADGIAVRRVGQLTYDICQEYVDDIVTVSDDEIAHAVLLLLEEEKIVAEGAGAAGVAALLGGKIAKLKGKKICAVVGGGNIDVNLIARVIERGLVESGRMMQLRVVISDMPGSLAQLLSVIGHAQANVVKVHHERAFSQTNLNSVTVEVILETRGKKHTKEIVSVVRKAGFVIVSVVANKEMV